MSIMETMERNDRVPGRDEDGQVNLKNLLDLDDS